MLLCHVLPRNANLTFSADGVAEAAVVGVNDELTGQAVNAFVALKDGNDNSDQTKKDLILQVRKSIGPFAAPKAIFVVPDLPKTRSGKIMRRILRKILAGEEDQLGDTTTVSRVSTCLVACHPPLCVARATRVEGLERGLTVRSCRTPRLSTKSLTWCIRPRRSRGGAEAFEWRASFTSLAHRVEARGNEQRRWVRPDGYRLEFGAAVRLGAVARTLSCLMLWVVSSISSSQGRLQCPCCTQYKQTRRCDTGSKRVVTVWW